MEMVVHYPTEEKELTVLNDRVAAIHAEYIYSYLCNKEFTKEQKLEIIDRIKINPSNVWQS